MLGNAYEDDCVNAPNVRFRPIADISRFRMLPLMQTAFSLPSAELDDDDRRFLEQVNEQGWFGTSVFDAEGALPSFSYSTGFWFGHQRPELILFGLKNDVAHDILWDAYRDIEQGRAFSVGVRTSGVFGNADAYLFPVAKRHYAEHLGWSRWFYRGDEFPCLHLIWPDRSGLFPWEAGFADGEKSVQPDLTENGWLAELQD